MMCSPNCPQYLKMSRTHISGLTKGLLLVEMIFSISAINMSKGIAAIPDKTLVYCFDVSPAGFDQSVVEGGCACCELWNGSGLVCVEPCWTNVKTIDERFIRYCGDAF